MSSIEIDDSSSSSSSLSSSVSSSDQMDASEVSNNESDISNEYQRISLTRIVNSRDLLALKELTNNLDNFTENVNFELWNELITLAIENDSIEIFRELKRLESNYEREFNENSFDDSSENPKRRRKYDANVLEQRGYKYRTVLDDISQLHDAIMEGNLINIKSFIDKYPKLKLCRDSRGFSALEKSINAKQFDIYALLKAKGFFSDQGKRLRKKIEKLNDTQKEQMRQEILNYTQDNTHVPDPISLILTRCELDACNDVISFHDVQEMLNTLIEIDEIKPILKILAQADVRIIFDYKNENVSAVDPTRDEFTLGVAYSEEGTLYVGRNQSKAQRYGTFAHEATHLVLYLIYRNFCLPYRTEDEERERVWEGIVENIRQIYERDPIGTDNIIKWVYELYNPGYQHNAELIVRVNDLLAFYHENPQKCEEVRETYAQLFDFYRDHVMPDLNNFNAFKIIKLNNDLKASNSINHSLFQFKGAEKFPLLDFKQNVQNALENLNEGNTRTLTDLSQKLQNFPCNNFLLVSNDPQMTISKLKEEISKKSSNKLDLEAKNIFIDFERLQQESLRDELKKTLKNSEEILRIVINVKDNDLLNDKNILEKLKFLLRIGPEKQIFFISSSKKEVVNALHNYITIEDSKIEIEGEKFKTIEENITKKKSCDNALNVLKINVKNSWNDLTENSQKKVLEQTLTDVEDKRFMLPSQEPEKLDSFISRRVLKKINDSKPVVKTLNKFIDEAEIDKIVVISDLAGSGKTTLLHKIHEILSQKLKEKLICFVSLREHSKMLSDHLKIGDNFVDILSEKILKLNEIERKIFELKYQRNEVVILFDGFDEISPTCKKNSLKLFELHKESGKSQIWVTTRTHLEHDIESALKVKAHAIKSLTEGEQIKYLSEFWQESCDDSNLRGKCAKLLVKEMTKMMKKFPNLIGIILQLRLLGERFKNELSENFEEKIKNLNIFEVYEYLAQSCTKFKEQNSIHNIFKYHTSSYEAFALKNLFGDKFPHLFGRTSTLEDFELGDALEEFTKGGIIRYDKDGKVSFLHRTVDEFFVSRFVKNRIKSFKPNWQYEKDFFKLLFEILSFKKFSVVKEFLDNSLIKFEEEIVQGEFKNFQKVLVKFVNESFDLEMLRKIFSQGLSVTLLFVLKCIQTESDESFKALMKKTNPQSKIVSCFGFCLEKSKDLELLGKFLDEVFSTFADDSELFDLLMQENIERETVFHKIAKEKNFETFKTFWSKVEERNFEYEEVLNFFSAEDRERRIFFSYIFEHKNFFDGDLNEVTKIVQRNLKTGDQKKVFVRNQFKLEKFEDEQKLKSILEFTRRIFDSEDFMAKIEEFNRKDIENLFKRAAERATKKAFELFLSENQTFTISSLEKEIWSKSILRAAGEQYNFEIFDFTFYKFLPKILNFKEFAYEVDGDGQNIFHFLVEKGNVEMIKIFITRAQVELTSDESKNYLKIKTKKDGVNALMLSAPFMVNYKIFHFLFDEVYLKVLNFKEFAYEVDKDGLNVFHLLIESGNVEMIKSFVTRVKTELSDEEFKNYIKIKTESGWNALMFSTSKDFDVFRFLFDEVYLKNLKFEEFACEVDKEYGKNIFHLLASKGNVEMAKYFVTRAQIKLSREELKNFFKIKTKKWSQNIFHLAAQSERNCDEIFKFLIEFVEELFTPEEIKEIASQRDGFKLLPHIYASNLSEARKILLKYFEQ